MIPLFSTTSAGVEGPTSSWVLLDTISTNSSSSAFNVTIDSSNGLPASGTGRLIFNIVVDQYQTDNQIFNIDVDSGTTVFDFESDNEGFQQASIQNADLNDYLSTQTDDVAKDSFYNGLTFSSILTATSGNGTWLRDSGDTTSQFTGIDAGTNDFIYFEATSNSGSGGHPIGGLARSPEFTVDSNPSMVINMGRFGVGFDNSAGDYGRLEIWWKIS
jgi:hypothetical protein